MNMEGHEEIHKDWKYYTGLILFVYSFIPYVVSGLIFFFKISVGEIIGILGVFLGSAELAFAISVVLLGKPFIQLLKAKFSSIFLRKKAVQPSKPIGKIRHCIGIAILLLSFLPWFVIEIAFFFDYPKTETDHMTALAIMLLADAMFVASLFTLGGDFWNRFKHLFQYPGQNNSAS